MKFNEYLLEEEESNLRQEVTGLPVIIWVSAGKDLPHGPRIKIQNDFSNKINKSNLIPITIEDEPKNIEGYEINSKVFSLVKEWIILNKSALLKHWNYEIDTSELLKSIKKLK